MRTLSPRLLFALLVCAALPAVAPAQSMLISDALSIRNDYGYEIIGRLRDRILLFRDKYEEFEVQAYDSQMRLSWTKEIEDLDRRGVQILAVIGSKNDFSVIHKQRKRSHAVLRLHKYDPGAKLIDSMVIKDFGERVFSPPVVEVLRSDDRNIFVALNMADPDEPELTCFRLDKMQVLWDKKLHLRDEYLTGSLLDMVVSDRGDFFMIGQDNNRRSRIEEHTFEIFHLDPTVRERLVKAPAPDFLTVDAEFSYDHANRRLVGAGLYSDKNRDRSNGTFFLTLPDGAGTAALRFEPFDDKFLSILRRKDGDDSGRGIEDVQVRQVIPRQDGGALLLAERFREVQRGTAAGRGFLRDGMRLVVDFFYDDVFIIATDPNGRVQWRTVLHKKQYSQDDEGTFSSYFLVRNPDKLHFLFNDEIKYENTCSEYILSPLGGFDRNSLLSTFGQNLRLRFRDGLQLNASECLIPSEYRNKLRLVLLKF